MPTSTPSYQRGEALSSIPSGQLQPTHDALEYLKAYAQERPEVAALWCFGIGFVLGWKLKLW